MSAKLTETEKNFSGAFGQTEIPRKNSFRFPVYASLFLCGTEDCRSLGVGYRAARSFPSFGKGGVNTDFKDYLRAETLILVPVLYLIGEGLKKSRVPNRHIPALLGVIGIIMSAVWEFSSDSPRLSTDIFGAVFGSVTQGVLAAGASVYANQLYIQKNRKNKK